MEWCGGDACPQNMGTGFGHGFAWLASARLRSRRSSCTMGTAALQTPLCMWTWVRVVVATPGAEDRDAFVILRFFPFLVNQVFNDKMAALLPQYLCYEPKPFVSANAVGSARLQF